MAEHCAKTVHEYEDFLADLMTTVESDERSILLARAVLNKSAGRAAEAAEARKPRRRGLR